MSGKCCNGTCENTTELKKCSLCFEDAYCSKECQQTAWNNGHKDECWGKKHPQILLAVEISLFGMDGGGSSVERIDRIEARLEGLSGKCSADRKSSSLKSRIKNLLTASYISPMVVVPAKDNTVAYSVFAPFCYLGTFKSVQNAHAVLSNAWQRMQQGQAPTVSTKGYVCDLVKNSHIPMLGWAEHAVIAIYLSKYCKERLPNEEEKQPYDANQSVTIPRSDIPAGVFMIGNKSPAVFKVGEATPF